VESAFSIAISGPLGCCKSVKKGAAALEQGFEIERELSGEGAPARRPVDVGRSKGAADPCVGLLERFVRAEIEGAQFKRLPLLV
jgi:hypothetical protein